MIPDDVTGRRGWAAFVSPQSRKVFDMIKLKDLTGVLRLMCLVVVVAVALPAALPILAPAAARAEGGTWQDLVFLYTTDIKGKIEPCG